MMTKWKPRRERRRREMPLTPEQKTLVRSTWTLGQDLGEEFTPGAEQAWTTTYGTPAAITQHPPRRQKK
jgi:hypothetical protein